MRNSLFCAATLCFSGQGVLADEAPSGLTITHNNYDRAVSGSTHEVGFTLNNWDQNDVPFTLSATGNALGSQPVHFGGSDPSGITSPISASTPGSSTQQPYSFLADTSGAAGTSITVGMTATETDPGTRTASSSFDLQLLENRTISFSLERSNGSVVSNEGVLDLGRFIGNRNFVISNPETGAFTPYSNWSINQNLSLKMSGGSQGRDLATDVEWNPAMLSNTYGVGFTDTTNSYSGLYYSKSYPAENSSTRDFNAADVSHALNLSFHANPGEFSKTVDFATAGHLAGGFTPESVKKEGSLSGVAISGAEVQFSGSEITVQGNSLSNRLIYAASASGNGLTTNKIDVYDYRDVSAQAGGLFDTNAEQAGVQARVMVGRSGSIAAGSETWTLSSPGLDDSTARVNFTGSGVRTSGFLSVDTGSAESITAFDGTATRDVAVSWGAITYGTTQGVGINTSNRGVYTSSINLTSNLSSGETGGTLSGQSLGNLSVGYSLEVVGDRTVFANNTHRKAFNGTEVGALTNYVSGNVGAYTNPTITNQEGVSKTLTNTSNYFIDEIAANMGTRDGGSGTRTLTVTPEGLAGERAEYEKTYNWSLTRVDKAQMTAGGTRADGTHPYQYLEHDFSRGEEVLGKVSLGTFSLTQTNAGAGVANARIDSYTNYASKGFTVATTTTNSGRAKTFDFSFDDTGLKNGTYFSSFYVEASHADQSIIGANWGDLGAYQHLFEVVVTGRGDNSGYKGFRLTQFDVTSAQVSEGDVSLEILDIIEPSGERGVAMEILAENGQVTGPNGETVGFTSGEVHGLQGIKFVLQSSYDEAELLKTFGTESVAVLLWKNARGEFVNAVLGNTGDAEMGALEGQPKVGQRFVGSYADYLLTLEEGVAPRLGDYGYDTTTNKVWAVLDHNSTFGGAGAVAAGVPEPSSLALLMMASLLAFRRRRA